MVDESFDTEFESKPPQPYEYRSKGPIPKILVISGGVLFNLVFAILILSFVTFQKGVTTYKTTVIGTVHPETLASFCGLKSGDEIKSINGVQPEH